MVKTDFKIDGVFNKIKRMIALTEDMRPVLLKIRGEQLNSTSWTVIGGIGAQFISQGSFYGRQWADLSEKPFWAWWKTPRRYYAGGYADFKRVNFPGKTILRATDKLFSALTVPGSDGNVEVLTPTSIAWGVNSDEIPYAKWHMTGTKKMKKREYLGITKEQRQIWNALIAQYILETQQAAGAV